MVQKLIVLGGSNGLREVIGIIGALNSEGHSYEVVGVLDDSESLVGQLAYGIPVLGKLDRIREYPNCQFVFAIGSLGSQRDRAAIFNSLGVSEDRFCSLIHPSAEIDPSATVGAGCILHKGASIGPGAAVGNFVIVAVNSAIGPDVKLEDFVLVTSFVLVLSRATLKASSYVGSMTCILEDIVVGRLARVGVGSVVNRDIPDESLAIGNPARLIGKI